MDGESAVLEEEGGDGRRKRSESAGMEVLLYFSKGGRRRQKEREDGRYSDRTEPRVVINTSLTTYGSGLMKACCE